MDNLNPDEFYVGIVQDADGNPSHHLVLLPGDSVGSADAAAAWAAQSGGELPTCRELALMLENAKAEFQQSWYWSCEPCDEHSGYTWAQDFYSGSQNPIQSEGLLARAIRRIAVT